MIKKFADDTKLYKMIKTEEDARQLQNDLHRILKWSEDWQMLFNIDKCKVVHIGRNNKSFKYSLNDKDLKTVPEEKDVGVIVTKDLKASRQCIEAVKKANKTLGMIKRNFRNLNKDIVIRLYKQLVRPHLEYAVQAWSPYLKKDIKLIEGVQRRATKIIPSFKSLEYRERLKRLRLTTLKRRRSRGDMIETYKILTGKEQIDRSLMFKLSKYRGTRGHQFKLYKPHSRLDIRKNFFSQRVITRWNKLPAEVVDVKTVNDFKIKIDEYYKRKDEQAGRRS